MPLSKVNNVSFEVSVMGRILNYGTLEIESASDDGDLVINDVPNVEDIQRKVYELHELDDSRRRGRGNIPRVNLDRSDCITLGELAFTLVLEVSGDRGENEFAIGPKT